VELNGVVRDRSDKSVNEINVKINPVVSSHFAEIWQETFNGNAIVFAAAAPHPISLHIAI
jgi:hypothetical protein